MTFGLSPFQPLPHLGETPDCPIIRHHFAISAQTSGLLPSPHEPKRHSWPRIGIQGEDMRLLSARASSQSRLTLNSFPTAVPYGTTDTMLLECKALTRNIVRLPRVRD